MNQYFSLPPHPKGKVVSDKWEFILVAIIKSVGLYVYLLVMNLSKVLGATHSDAASILIRIVIQDGVLLLEQRFFSSSVLVYFFHMSYVGNESHVKIKQFW